MSGSRAAPYGMCPRDAQTCSRSPLHARAMIWSSARDIAIFQHLSRKNTKPRHSPSTRAPHFLDWQISQKAAGGTSTAAPNRSAAHGSPYGTERVRRIPDDMTSSGWINVSDLLYSLSHAETNTRWTFNASMEQSMSKKRDLLYSGLLDETTQDENHFVSLPIPDLTMLRTSM